VSSAQEPLITLYLHECVEGLRRREHNQRNAARMANHAGDEETAQRWSDAADLTRAALAVFERLAAVEVEIHEYTVNGDGSTPVDFTVQAGRHYVPCWPRANGTWFVGPTPEPENHAAALLTAALECRRRNGEVG
jgi:hypothetical protein